MICLSGCTGRKDHVAFLQARGHGRLVTPQCWRPARPDLAYGVDNGAFAAWTHGKPFPGKDFLAMLAKVPRGLPPMMVVCPDKVAAGRDSLAFSRRWRSRLEAAGYGWMPWYLAVQDGMTATMVARDVASGKYAGIFVGGTLAWKHRTAEAWVRFAHANGLKCHVGRVFQLKDLAWAERIGADSVDSTGWARQDRHDILDALAAQSRLEVQA